MSTASVAPSATVLAQTSRGRIALAVTTPVGPLAMAGWAVSTPYDPASDIPASAAAIAADPVGAQWGLLFLIVAGVFGAIASLVVGAAIRRGAPHLGAVATALTFVGFCVAAYPGPVAAVAAAPAVGLVGDDLLTFIGGIDGQVQGSVINVLFVTLPAGILLLGIAALVASRRHAYLLWAAIVLVAAIPLVMLGGFIAGWALAIGWVVVAVGFGAGGWQYATGTPAAARRHAG